MATMPHLRTSLRTRKARRVLAALLMGLLGSAPTVSADQLPSLGSQTGGALTATQEREIGKRFLSRAQRQLTFVQDPEILEYVRTIGHRIAAQTDFHAYPFHFYVVQDPSLNAFAVPGGYIFLHSGLIEATDSAAELAGVLAHEIAHITQRHMARQVAASQQTQLESLLLVLAGVMAGMQGQGEAAQALVAGASAYSQQEMLSYSRSHEHEADRLGVGYLAASGFDPEGLPAFLEELQNWAQLQGQSPPAYMSTHPLTTNRISDARNRASRMQAASASTPLGEDTFQRIRARMRAISAESSQEAYNHFREAVKRRPQDHSARYGLALAARFSGRTEEAIGILRGLMEDAPEEVAYRSALAELLLSAGRPGGAVQAIRSALELRPDAPELREQLGEAQLAEGNASEALRTLVEVTRDYPDRASAHRALAEAYARTDQPIQAHRAEAEARWLLGQRAEALEQLRLAERLAQEQSSDQLGLIRARIKELQL
ncbi:M48 family metalloprotease [Thiohalorhabdus sp. Cl-TMA]|uniref:M48 family metalloprotease n=1 Tax=Thiohalorhabdus methylotrophus TaxID=3242694 RepID=A0ABV4TTL8_9GAMM